MSETSPAPTTPPPGPGLPGKAASFLVGVFAKNLPVKLAALVLALIVWFTVRQDLTATHDADQCEVRYELPEKVVWLDPPPRHLRVEFKGPRSRIDDVKKAASVTLRVTKEDLAGQKEAPITFSLERGNILHDFGRDIEIVSVAEAPFELRVAELDSKRVRVRPPVVTGFPEDDWRAEAEIVEPEVLLVGPRSSLDKITEVQPDPIDASGFFEGRTEVVPLPPRTLPLSLPAQLKDLSVTLADGAQLRCVVSFPVKTKSVTLTVPIEVRTKNQTSAVVLNLRADDPVRLDESSGQRKFLIDLEFMGAPTDLAALRAAVAEGTVTAFVMAEDSPGYRDGDEGTDYINKAYVRTDGLPKGVRQLPPSLDISVTVDPR